ncbi:MAG: hypothetical protein WC628_08540 [Candidatus Omnitrophota bacterium]
MRKTALIIFLLVVAPLFVKAYAHAPEKITITYDLGTDMLKAVIEHHVDDPQTHFIKRVDIGLNGKKLITQEILEQDNPSTETISYMISEVKAGDRVSVEAFCSVGGSLKEEIVIR